MDTRVHFFSQNGEDFLLWRFFRERDRGFFVDVGAFDGGHLSNTLTFETQGWSGICIEPHPEYFGMCQRARPRSICLNVACVGSDALTSVPFYMETLGLLSGLDPNRDEDVQARYRGRGMEFGGFRQVLVPAATLNSILQEHLAVGHSVDFISIDVEGTELDVLQGLDLEQFRPRVLVVESSTPHARLSLETYLVRSHGYIEARRLIQNGFYVREPGDAD